MGEWVESEHEGAQTAFLPTVWRGLLSRESGDIHKGLHILHTGQNGHQPYSGPVNLPDDREKAELSQPVRVEARVCAQKGTAKALPSD